MQVTDMEDQLWFITMSTYLGPIIHYENLEKLFFISTFYSQEELAQERANLETVHGAVSGLASVMLLFILILYTAVD